MYWKHLNVNIIENIFYHFFLQELCFFLGIGKGEMTIYVYSARVGYESHFSLNSAANQVYLST